MKTRKAISALLVASTMGLSVTAYPGLAAADPPPWASHDSTYARRDDGRADYRNDGRGNFVRMADDRYDHGDDRHDRDYRDHDNHRGHDWHPVVRAYTPPHEVVVPGRVRHYRNVVIVRRYGHVYPGYGWYRTDADAYKWLGLTAITLGILNYLTVTQERALEAAQVQATTAPIGQGIIWNSSGASGTVTPLRDGTSTSGEYCREFQQTVTIGGRTEQAYGTACQQPDGSWQVVQAN